jgi:FkbM family methyltransferase
MLINRPIAFVLASTDHGAMILNRHDYQMMDKTSGIGVGFEMLTNSAYDRPGVGVGIKLLQLRRKYFGDGVVALDVGANVGVMTVEWARAMTRWGNVLAFEPQSRVFYALCGNIALNNCFNAHAMMAAVSDEADLLRIPQLDPTVPANFGGLNICSLYLDEEVRNKDWLGQKVDALPSERAQVVKLDSFGFSRVDLIKIDVEGMELRVLDGAKNLIDEHKPILIVEHIKCGALALRERLTERYGYRISKSGLNFIAVHESDPGVDAVREGQSPPQPDDTIDELKGAANG